MLALSTKGVKEWRGGTLAVDGGQSHLFGHFPAFRFLTKTTAEVARMRRGVLVERQAEKVREGPGPPRGGRNDSNPQPPPFGAYCQKKREMCEKKRQNRFLPLSASYPLTGRNTFPPLGTGSRGVLMTVSKPVSSTPPYGARRYHDGVQGMEADTRGWRSSKPSRTPKRNG